MLTLTSPMQTALTPRTSAASISRNRTILFEVYDSSYLPTAGVFDPGDAIVLWAKTEILWAGNTYDRRIISHSPMSQYIGKQFNNVTLTIDNAQRYLANFIETNIVDGMRLVVRYINIDLSATLADSVVRFVGRLETPDGSEIDRDQGDLTAKEELATLDEETPRRRISSEDPEGRSPNDPLYEGFLFNARPSLVRFAESVPTSRLFGLLRGSRDVIKYNQWGSDTSSAADQIVPLILGRVQREGLPAFWVDIGFFIIAILVYSAHKITSITNFFLPDPNYIFYGFWADETNRQTHVHLGDPGGTGTNAIPDTVENNYPQNTAVLSRTGYVGFAIGGPETETQPFANPQADSVPTLVSIVCGEMDLPDGSGVFNQKGFSDSPVYAGRFVLTSEDFFNLDPELVNDTNLPSVHAERQRPIVDKSNGEFLALMSHDASAVADGRLVRLNSTGLIDARYFRHLLDSGYPDPLVTNRDDIFSVAPGSIVPGGGDQQLTNGVGLGAQTVGSGLWKYYYIDTPIGATQLQVIATGSGDGTSFIRVGSKPTLTAFDDFAYTASPQIMTITNPTAGRWWIGIAGFQPDGTVAAGLSYSIIAVVSGGMAGAVLAIRPEVRKAYTTNIALTDTVNASDFLHDVVYSTGRLYHVIDSAGRIDIRAKKASDSAYLISNASIGHTSLQIANVEPWRASAQGYVLIDVGQITSEYRRVTGAVYNATIGDAITLAVSSPGTSISASGATLAGGNSTTPSSGTVTVNSIGTVGDVLTVTVWGIPITYTVSATDNVNSIAGMLASWINADPDLRQYVRAVWNSATVVTIYSTVGTLSFATALVNAHLAQLDSPVAATTAAAAASGTLIPGIYYLGYTDVDGSGNETLMSPLASITIASGEKVSVTSGSLPAGVAERNWYFSPAHDDDDVRFLLTNTGGTFTINSVPDSDNDFPPTLNSTGCETIRIMEVFNQYNIRKDTFKWTPPQSKINQVSGSFIDAANGFKRTPITVNDRAHQRAVRKVNKLEVNLNGVDNFALGSKLLHASLSEERNGERFKLSTDDAGIPLEIGDVVAVATQYVNSAGVVVKEFVNQPVVIEQADLQEDFDVAFDCRIYSSSLMEGQIGRKPVVVSTTLKYFTEAPPVATSLVLTADDTFITGIIGDFDFGDFASDQAAHIYIKGPATSEPADSTYQLIDLVTPDASNHGHFEFRAIVGGQYWVKVETESAFGKKAASGHPVETINLRAAAVSDIIVTDDGFGDWLIQFTGHPRTIERPETYTVEIWESTGRTDPDEHFRNLPITPNSGHAVLLVSNSGFTVH